jgi:heme-degrading monooxygenase HmoA
MVYLVDLFTIPQDAIQEFSERTAYNREFIRHLNGFVSDQIMQRRDEAGNLVVMTIATWKDKQALEAAKEAVGAEYKRIGFNPQQFVQERHIQLQRNIFE